MIYFPAHSKVQMNYMELWKVNEVIKVSMDKRTYFCPWKNGAPGNKFFKDQYYYKKHFFRKSWIETPGSIKGADKRSSMNHRIRPINRRKWLCSKNGGHVRPVKVRSFGGHGENPWRLSTSLTFRITIILWLLSDSELRLDLPSSCPALSSILRFSPWYNKDVFSLE